MTIKLHPSIETRAEQLADFQGCADISHLFTDLVKDATNKPAFQQWIKAKSNVSEASETSKPNGRNGRKNGVTSTVTEGAAATA